MPVRTTKPASNSQCRMTADAVVVASRPDGLLDLEFAPIAGCSGCAGTCLWKRLQAARLDRLPAASRLEPGTKVTVALSARRLLLASTLLYGAPLAAILAGAAAGSLLTGSDLGTLTGAAAALALTITGLGALRRRLEQSTLSGLVVTPKP